jgi:hypothetical protein
LKPLLLPLFLALVTVPAVAEPEPGSLAREVQDAVDLRIDGKDSAAASVLFSAGDRVVEWNTRCWAADLAWHLTALSVWNSQDGPRRAGVLVSPRHLLFAAHFPIAAGSTVRFLAADGTVVQRTVTAVKVHPEFKPNYPDVAIGVLDANVPPSISFVKVLPDDWRRKIPSPGGLPVLSLDQWDRAGVRDVAVIGEQSIVYREPQSPARAAFYHPLIVGDSGKPAFWIIGNELVLLNVWTGGGAGSGTWLVPQKVAINAMMKELGGGYQLTDIDLSGFPSYPESTTKAP